MTPALCSFPVFLLGAFILLAPKTEAHDQSISLITGPGSKIASQRIAMAGSDLQPGISPREVTLDTFTLALDVPAREHPRLGTNRFVLHITDQAGEPVVGAKVRVTYTLADRKMIPGTISMESGNPGSYEATVNLGVGGTWNLTVQVDHADHSTEEVTFSVTVAPSSLLGG